MLGKLRFRTSPFSEIQNALISLQILSNQKGAWHPFLYLKLVKCYIMYKYYYANKQIYQTLLQNNF